MGFGEGEDLLGKGLPRKTRKRGKQTSGPGAQIVGENRAGPVRTCGEAKAEGCRTMYSTEYLYFHKATPGEDWQAGSICTWEEEKEEKKKEEEESGSSGNTKAKAQKLSSLASFYVQYLHFTHRTNYQELTRSQNRV